MKWRNVTESFGQGILLLQAHNQIINRLCEQWVSFYDQKREPWEFLLKEWHSMQKSLQAAQDMKAEVNKSKFDKERMCHLAFEAPIQLLLMDGP